MSTSWRVEHTRRLCLDAMLCVAALLLSYLESLLPLNLIIPLPGFRLGLVNVAVMAVFCLISPVDAAVISGMRILVMGLLFGSATSLYFSAMGGLFSFIMLLFLRTCGKKCSFIGVSILSAAAHNTGQILAAVTLFGVSLIPSYLPWLLLASIFYGGVIGILLNLLIPKLSRALSRVLKNGGHA